MLERLLKFLVGFGLALALLANLWLGSTSASPTLVDPRLNRLESQVRSLQSQLRQLQARIPRAGERQSTRLPPVLDEPTFDQQFDHLAILIIELQNRVSALEARLNDSPTQ